MLDRAHSVARGLSVRPAVPVLVSNFVSHSQRHRIPPMDFILAGARRLCLLTGLQIIPQNLLRPTRSDFPLLPLLLPSLLFYCTFPPISGHFRYLCASSSTDFSASCPVLFPLLFCPSCIGVWRQHPASDSTYSSMHDHMPNALISPSSSGSR